MLADMNTTMSAAVPVLPAADAIRSLAWWTEVCGFTEVFRDATPPRYAGLVCGGARLHVAQMSDVVLAATVGAQTMVRIQVEDLDSFFAEFQRRGGVVHPNGGLETKPWGTREFSAIDPNGVCVAFVE